jgi:hypothetical protein
MSRRVVETEALEPLGPVGRQAPVVGAGGEHDATSAHLLAIVEHQFLESVQLARREPAASVGAGDDGAELRACSVARWVNSEPDRPVGKPR